MHIFYSLFKNIIIYKILIFNQIKIFFSSGIGIEKVFSNKPLKNHEIEHDENRHTLG